MIMFAVIYTGGKQYLVKEGDKIRVEKLNVEPGKNYTFESVLLTSQDGKAVELGTPFLKKTVEAKILSQDKSDKIRVYKMKAKKNYRRVYGHRQPYTELEITHIG